MSADLATLLRKADLVLAKQDLILARLDQQAQVGKPGLTQRAFAKLIGKSPRTVARKIASKEIRSVKGLLPYSEARKFLS